MQVMLCGVRGSTPAAGAQYCDVGGHTSCVGVAGAPHEWTLVLDAGTGLRRLDAVLNGAPFRGTIVLTHLHWDHAHGLPFFTSGDRTDARVDLYLPAQDGLSPGDDAAALLARGMSPPHFPIGPDGLRGTWRFLAFGEGSIDVPGFHVTAAEVPHKGGRTMGFRIESDGRAFAYMPDHRPGAATPAQRRSALALSRDVDVLLHGAPFFESERATADVYGHATVDDAIELAAEAGAARLVLVHHAPHRTDVDIETLTGRLETAPMPVVVGREGDVLDI
jgi:ribonuclease BN (tRNA processing enzyme)